MASSSTETHVNIAPLAARGRSFFAMVESFHLWILHLYWQSLDQILGSDGLLSKPKLRCKKLRCLGFPCLNGLEFFGGEVGGDRGESRSVLPFSFNPVLKYVSKMSFFGWNKFVVDQRFEMFFMFYFLGTRGTRGYHGFGSNICLFHFLTIDPSNTSKQFPFKHGKYTRKMLVPGNVMGSLYAVMLHGNCCCGRLVVSLQNHHFFFQRCPEKSSPCLRYGMFT